MSVWRDFIARVSFRPSFPLRLAVSADGTRLRASLLDIPDRDTGDPAPVHMEWEIPTAAISDRDGIRFVRMLVEDLLSHELDECLLLDGKQVRDPHAILVSTQHKHT